MHVTVNQARVVQIRGMLPENFGILFDGWTEGRTHYVSILAGIPFDSFNGYRALFLGFSPLENEITKDAQQHML